MEEQIHTVRYIKVVDIEISAKNKEEALKKSINTYNESDIEKLFETKEPEISCVFPYQLH